MTRLEANWRCNTLGPAWFRRLRIACAWYFSGASSFEEERDRLKYALESIERFGHGDGHGRGYTCANMAQSALRQLHNK